MSHLTGPELRLTCVPSLDVAADEVASVLRGPWADTFAAPVVCVDDAGVQRWLMQRLAERLGAVDGDEGVCAGIRFVTVHRLLRSVDGGWDWASTDATGAIAGLVQDHPEDYPLPAAAMADGRPGSAMAVSRRIAELFRNLARHRPALMRYWSQGDDVLPDGGTLPPEHIWQARLWRALALPERTAEEPAPPSAILLDPPLLAPLEQQQVQALAQVSALHAVVVHPVATTHPLTRALGTRGVTAAEQWHRLADCAHTDNEFRATDSLLGRLRKDIHRGEVSPHPADGSLVLHSSHGPLRQAEVVRELLTRRFVEDPTLQPRDVVIRCVDPARQSPALAALTMGLPSEDDPHPGRDLRVASLTSSLREHNRVLAVLEDALVLVPCRHTVAEVVDHLMSAPVAAARGVDPQDVDRLQQLIAQAGITWGLSPEHRAEFGVGHLSVGTWSHGVDRLVAGVAMSADSMTRVGNVVPADDVSDADLVLVAALRSTVEDLEWARTTSSASRSLHEWVEWAQELIGRTCAPGPDDAWMVPGAHATLQRVLSDGGSSDTPLDAGDFLIRLRAVTSEPRRSPNVGSGDLVVCGLRDLPRVPHRVTVLVGADDGTFPRRPVMGADDLCAMSPLPTDPDPAADDAQALLDILHSTSDAVDIVHAGTDPATHERAPLPLPLVHLQQTWAAMTSEPAHHLLTAHTAQPWGVPEFRMGSHDRRAHATAQALAAPIAVPAPTWRVPLPPLAPTDVTLEQVQSFLLHPAKALLRRRARISLTTEEPVPDQIPVDLDGLEAWKIGDRVLQGVLTGVPLETLLEAEHDAGHLPPGELAHSMVMRLRRNVNAVAQRWREATSTASREWHRLDLPADGVRLTGDVETWGDALVTVGYSSHGPRPLLRGWVLLNALSAAHPEVPWRWVNVARDGTHVLGPLPRPQWAPQVLDNLVELHHLGMQTCLPLPVDLGHLYALRRRRLAADSDSLLHLCRELWHKRHAQDPAWTAFFPTFEDLWSAVPRPDDSHRITDEPRRLGTLARRLWQPIMATSGGS